MVPGQAFEFTVNDLLSVEQKDWYFYEIETLKPDFDNYEGIAKEDMSISTSKHSITGIAPKTPGFYYYIVDMKYVSTEGNTLFFFETTLELVVKGIESSKNHQTHTKNGYQHRLKDHLNQTETSNVFKFISLVLIVLFAFFSLAVVY